MLHSRITTKRGDDGTTSALDGTSYPKSHPIMEFVGTLDELRAHISLLRLLVLEQKPDAHQHTADVLLWLAGRLFPIGAACSDPQNQHPELHPRKLAQADIDSIENEQLTIENSVTLPHSFILAASNTLAAQADIACAVARRLERQFVRLRENVPGFEAPLIMVFLNRLSDYLFLLARRLENGKHITLHAEK